MRAPNRPPISDAVYPAAELPQVRVDGDDEVYYNLLKLVKENGRDVDAPFAKKGPNVRRGE
jgi:hypothetical protein